MFDNYCWLYARCTFMFVSCIWNFGDLGQQKRFMRQNCSLINYYEIYPINPLKMVVSRSLSRVLMYCLILLLLFKEIIGDCSMLNFCNGHGVCINSTSICKCYEGWGSEKDTAFYKAPDCSARTCPSDRAWADVPTSPTTAHALAECSNRGACDRSTGLCKCFDGFVGSACQRTKCPNDCSGHGVCVSIKQMARMSNALPLAPNTYYEGDEDSTTWDEDKVYGCVCDSSWPVGLGPGQRQEPEWFGPDCSQRHCPSADNPRTFRVETNCEGVKAKDSQYSGEAGNLCHVDCADQGICDYSTGTCQCFDGMFGDDCSIIDPRAVYDYWKKRKATLFTSRDKEF